MKYQKSINPKELESEAIESGCGESYKIIAQNNGLKISVGARHVVKSTTSYFIEVILKLCTEYSSIDLKKAEKSLELLRVLERGGYTLSCDEGIITCEKEVGPQSLKDECERLIQMIEGRCGKC